MNWFKGSVTEAINSAKSCCGIFVVFIYDKSDLSKSTREKLEDKEVYEVLSSSKCVAIEIENGSTDAIQFAQIYPLIIVPSLFFISPENGIPLEIIGGHFEVNALVEKLQKVLSLSTTPPAATQNSEGASAKEVLPENAEDVKLIQKSEPEKDQPIATDNDETVTQAPKDHSVTAAQENPAPLEERVQRARELINERAETKAQEQIEEAKRKELERRQQMQELAKAKEKREEMERSELSRQRKKEKEEARLARERVKAQIAADKAERLSRESILKGETPLPLSSPPMPDGEVSSRIATTASGEQASGSAMTRIKFRFPDNSSNSAQFSSDATLSEVKSHLIENCNLSFSRFKLIATLPPRTFTDDQMLLTLSELGLTPSAIIIVKPFQGTSPSSLVPSGDGIMNFFWSLLSPLAFLINYLNGILGFGRPPATSNDSSDDDERLLASSQPPRTEGSYTTRNRPKTAYGRPGERDSFTRREGNIYRFDRPGNDDDDDDNNTWNGNSTQQM